MYFVRKLLNRSTATAKRTPYHLASEVERVRGHVSNTLTSVPVTRTS